LTCPILDETVLIIQDRLEFKAKKEILADLRTPDRIRENLDVVETILGFLSTGGGMPETQLGEYIKRVLSMQRKSFSPKVTMS